MPVRRYQRGISLFQVEDTATGINHTYSQDEQKSTVYITRNDGEVENCYAYDAFGNVLESRESIENRIRYTGQQYDQVTGQHYLRARYYNPVIGRFIQEDTYRGDGLNLYAYCGNNPVRYHDSSGRYEQEYSDDFTTESGQSRVEQVDGEVGNVAGGMEYEGDIVTLSGQWKNVNESMSDFSRAYQKQITGQEGMAWVQNGVKYDGMKDGVLLDAKGNYAQFIDKSTGEFYDWFSGKESLIAEARRQIDASEGAKIQWYFAEEESLNVVQDLFMDKGITGIELFFVAPE